MKKTILFMLLAAGSLLAQTAGESGLAFLKLGFGARNIAMGDLGVVSSNDVTSSYYNPALVVNNKNVQVMISHNKLIQGASSELLGVGFTLFDLPFAVALNTTNISDIEVRTKPGPAESSFDVHYFFGSISSGIEIVDNLALGISFKYLYEGLYADEATGWGVDFGVHYKGIIEGLDVGGSLRNLGTMNELRNEKTKLPVDLRVGASYNLPIEQFNSDLAIIGGLQKFTATDDIHNHIGTEIFYDNLFAIRGGYITGYEAKGFTVGAGVFWNNINFDYAFVPYQYGLDNSHTISLMYTFN